MSAPECLLCHGTGNSASIGNVRCYACGGTGKPRDSMPRQVHIVDETGQLVYTRLWDAPGSLLQFASGHGWIIRAEIPRDWEVREGWPPTKLSQG